MQRLAEEALAAGAFGISSGLEYPPSANASREELAELCRVLAPVRGLYVTHMRNEDDRLLESVEEAGLGELPIVACHFFEIFFSTKTTCLRAMGSYFLISSWPCVVRLFFVVT